MSGERPRDRGKEGNEVADDSAAEYFGSGPGSTR